MLELPFIELRKTGRGDFEERSKVKCGTCSIFFIVVIKSYYCLINKLEYPCGLLLIPTQTSSFFSLFSLVSFVLVVVHNFTQELFYYADSIGALFLK